MPAAAHPKWGRVVAGVGALGAVTAGQPAAAQVPAASLAAAPVASAPVLSYDAPPECPDRDSWLREVAARRAGTVASGAATPAQILARLAIDASGTQARLRFRGSEAERVLSGHDCQELSAASALIVAIALGTADGTAAAREADPVPAPEHAPAAAVSAGGGEPVTASHARAVAVSAIAPATPAAAPEPDAGLTRAAADARVPAWSLALGMGAEANSWLGPWPAAVFDAAFDALAPTRAWSARLAASFGMAQRRVNRRSAEFRFWGGRVDVCPFVLAHEPGWRWSSCAAAQLGVLHAWGDEQSALAQGFSRSTAWSALELRSRLQTPPIWALRLEAEAGLGVPLLGREFRFGAPAETVFASPPLGVFIRAGVLFPLAGVPD
jgi:hypothetical protein